MKKLIKKKEYYVYVWLDPRKQGKYKYGEHNFLHEPIYVGKGKGRRLGIRTHGHNCFLQNKLSKFSEPIILQLMNNLTEKKAHQLEKELINLIGRGNKGPLCNLTDGGEGASGRKITEKTRQQMIRSQKNRPSNYRIGTHHSEETKKKMSMAAKLRPPVSEETKQKIREKRKLQICTKETKLKMSLSHLGKKHSEEVIKRRLESKRKLSEETKKKISESAKKRYSHLKR